jgi:hypothetical protein
MRCRATGAALAALFFSAPVLANAADAIEAARWQAMARTDLDAVHALILEAHPGVIDEANPGFGEWVSKGYEQAGALVPYVSSYDTAMAVSRYYATGFQDGHLMYSDNARHGYPVQVTGWNIDWRNGRYEVFKALEDWPVPLPPVGSEWTGCDGLDAEEVLKTREAPFSDRREGAASREHRISGLWMRKPVATGLRECSFRTPAGESLRLPVHYQAIPEGQFFDSLAHLGDGGARAANSFELRDGVLWVRAGNFMLHEGTADRTELEAMLAGLAKAKDVRAIVFDVRGNDGGDSGIGDRIFEAATGGLAFDQENLEVLPRYYAQWRVSRHLLRFLEAAIGELQAIYGADSDLVREEARFRDEVAAAKAAGKFWVEQDVGRTITREDVIARHGHLRRFPDAKVALLTHSRCVSACLDFADVLRQVPGMKQVGETTGADSVYMVGSRAALPSGNMLILPVKVWRNRIRGNNEVYAPDVPVDLDAKEATIRANVLRALGMLRLLEEDQPRGDHDQAEAGPVVPLQRLAQVRGREGREHHQRDHLLHALELRRAVDRVTPAVGRHL